MQAQCWICPKCHDDHSPYKDCAGRMICADCKTVEGVKATRCPINWDIHDKITDVQLCDSCYHNRGMDI